MKSFSFSDLHARCVADLGFDPQKMTDFLMITHTKETGEDRAWICKGGYLAQLLFSAFIEYPEIGEAACVAAELYGEYLQHGKEPQR